MIYNFIPFKVVIAISEYSNLSVNSNSFSIHKLLILLQLLWSSPKSNCSNSNIALLESYSSPQASIQF